MTLTANLPLARSPTAERSLSPDALTLLREIRLQGELGARRARALICRRPARALQELQDAWLVVYAPGAGGGRGAFVPVHQGSGADDLTVQRAARQLSGLTMTLRGFALRLNLSTPNAFAVLRALCERNLATGQAVGATFVFHVHSDAHLTRSDAHFTRSSPRVTRRAATLHGGSRQGAS